MANVKNKTKSEVAVVATSNSNAPVKAGSLTQNVITDKVTFFQNNIVRFINNNMSVDCVLTSLRVATRKTTDGKSFDVVEYQVEVDINGEPLAIYGNMSIDVFRDYAQQLGYKRGTSADELIGTKCRSTIGTYTDKDGNEIRYSRYLTFFNDDDTLQNYENNRRTSFTI